MNIKTKRIFTILFGSVILLIVLLAIRYGREPSYFGANVLWDALDIKGWWDREVRLPFKEIPSTTPDRFIQVKAEKDIMVSMRDGVRLDTDVYMPDARGPFPVILIRLPYGKSEAYTYMPAIGRFWASKGYAFVVQDVRGKFGSEGVYDPFVNEENDGYDTLDWASQQPWSDGKIGMMGESYYAFTAWAGAVSGHPNLRAVSASTISMDIYRTTFRGGALALQTMGDYAILMDSRTYQNDLRLDWWHLPLDSLASDAGLSDSLFRMLVTNPTRNELWERINLHHRYPDVTIPTLHFGGWYDVFLSGTVADWFGIRATSPSASVRSEHWIVLGPWDHEYTTEDTHRIGRLDIQGDDTFNRWDELQAFFDHWLMGIENGYEDTPPVRYFTIGANEWRSASRWPPIGTVYRDYYLHSGGNAHLVDGDGTLSRTPPTLAEPPDKYAYDPLDPVKLGMDEMVWMLADTLKDRRELPARPDVLVYDTAPLEADVEITGPIVVTLFASSSAVDTDFTASLVDVFTDGYAHLIQEGILRASHRDLDSQPSPIEPGRVYQYTIDLWATSFLVKAGHRIRVEISSSNFNIFDRNLNTGEPFGTGANPIIAHQQVFHNPEYPSRITLPVHPR